MVGLVGPRPKEIRSGSLTTMVATLAYPVTFTTPMPNTNYTVYFNGGLVTGLGMTSKTTSGFTILITISVIGTVGWVAMED